MLRCWSRADTLSRRTCTHSRFFRSHAKKLDFLTRKIQLVLKVRTSQTLTKMSLSSGLVFVCLCLHVVFGQFGFFPNPREDRRYGNQFGFGQNFLPNPSRIRNRLTGILHIRPENQNSNPSFIYPFNNRPGISNDGYYDQQGRPTYPYQNNQNYPYTYPNENQFNNANPIQFPQSYPDQQFENQNPSNQMNNDNVGFVVIENPPVVQDTERATEGPNATEIPTFEKPKDETASFENKNSEDVVETSGFPDWGKNSEQEPSQGFPTVPPLVDFVPPTGLPPLTPVAQEDSTAPPQPTSFPLEPVTGLQELTPVPASETRNNFNFGTQGLFKEVCETVEGQVGSCVTLYQCEPYVALLQQSKSNPALVQVLRKAHCGFDGNDPKVCCPRPGFATAPPPPPPPPPTTTTVASVDEAVGKSADHSDYIAAFPEPPVCGVSNASFSRVVGGVDAKLGDFPWMALLGYKSKRDGSTRWLCGGSLMSSKHILTAAHCIHGLENQLYIVRLGELDLAKEDEGATPVDVLIKSQIKHEKYDPNAYTNDIGVLVLERDVEFTTLIRPICIPRASELRTMTFENYNPIIAGWGDTQFRGPSATHLQALQLPVVSNDFCKQAYIKYKKQVIDERVLCAGYKKGGKDACQGDSGGPLMQPIWNSHDYTTHFYQIGVVSFGFKCAEPGFPGIYSRVTHFVPWLEEKVIGTL